MSNKPRQRRKSTGDIKFRGGANIPSVIERTLSKHVLSKTATVDNDLMPEITIILAGLASLELMQKKILRPAMVTKQMVEILERNKKDIETATSDIAKEIGRKGEPKLGVFYKKFADDMLLYYQLRLSDFTKLTMSSKNKEVLKMYTNYKNFDKMIKVYLNPLHSGPRQKEFGESLGASYTALKSLGELDDYMSIPKGKNRKNSIKKSKKRIKKL